MRKRCEDFDIVPTFLEQFYVKDVFESLPVPEPSRGSFGGTWEMVGPGEEEEVDQQLW